MWPQPRNRWRYEQREKARPAAHLMRISVLWVRAGGFGSVQGTTTSLPA